MLKKDFTVDVDALKENGYSAEQIEFLDGFSFTEECGVLLGKTANSSEIENITVDEFSLPLTDFILMAVHELKTQKDENNILALEKGLKIAKEILSKYSKDVYDVLEAQNFQLVSNNPFMKQFYETRDTAVLVPLKEQEKD